MARSALASPARRTRATNLDATPAIPIHEIECRAAYRENKIKNASTSAEKRHKTAAFKAMVALKMGSFEFVEGNHTVDAIIAPGSQEVVDIDKLYGLVTAGTITLPQFLSVCKAAGGTVKDTLGANVLAAVQVTVATETQLTIKERK